MRRPPFGRANQLVMRNSDRMQRRLDLAPPMVEKLEQHRKIGREIVLLPDEQLQERRGIGTVEMDFRRGQPVAL